MLSNQDRAGGADVNKSFLEIKTVVDTTITHGSCYCWVLLHISLWWCCQAPRSGGAAYYSHQHCSQQRGLIESEAGLYGSVATCSALQQSGGG